MDTVLEQEPAMITAGWTEGEKQRDWPGAVNIEEGVGSLKQLTMDGYLGKELICCSISETYHWIRISCGHTPSIFKNRIHFSLHGYDYFYEDTVGKVEILQAFNGKIRMVSWQEALNS